MKIVFAHDHKFCRDEAGIYYSDGQFPYSLWKRYLQVFDEIVVMGRVRPLRKGESFEQLDVSSGENVRFVEIPSLSTPWVKFFGSKEVEHRVSKEISMCEGVIVRNSEIGNLAASLAQQMKKPWLIEIVSSAFDGLWYHGSLQGKLYALYAEYELRHLVRKAPFASYVTEAYLQGKYPCEGRSLACSDVQLPPHDQAVMEKRLRRIEDKKAPLVIGMIASLTHGYKGVDVAIKAMKLLKQRNLSFEFHILGGGNVKRWQAMAAREGVSKEIIFCGTVPTHEVPFWLDDVDIYIQPSFMEGLPRALVEAMSRGCPALGSRVCGIPELLEVNYLHQAGDWTSLATLLQKALEDKEWRKTAAIRNFNKTLEYDQDKLNQARKKFWQEFKNACLNHQSN